jgi:hypothetical protein
VGILDNSFTTKLGYLILLNYLISLLVRDLLNSVREGINVSINGEFPNADDS